MATSSERIREHLDQVRSLRAARSADPELGQRVAAIKEYQHARFRSDYAALLASERYGAATRFFLDDLYSPVDFSARDAQFERVVPAMERLFPADVMDTVARLAELHALTERLDQEMARQVKVHAALDDASYREAWRAVGRADARQRQLALLLDIGVALERHTRTPLLATTLRLMRAPARAAGLGTLQSFLERGLQSFVAMGGSQDFLSAIKENEERVMADMF